MVEIEKVKGKSKGKIMLYALSTCGWCRKTKQLLDSLGVEYSYVYVDYLEGDDSTKTMDEIKKWNSKCSFPTLVINDKKCIIGFNEDEILEALDT